MSNTRKLIIAGNWKLNKTPTEAVELMNEINDALGQETEVATVVCPPFTALAAVGGTLENSTVQLGAQNMYPKASGAYTGEVSAVMLRDLFCNYVILGHSERREYFCESDAFINEKVLAAFENNLKPILCVGESLEEREADKTLDVIAGQIKADLEGVSAEAAENLIVAYEPIWAIGTGRTATPEMAQEVHASIRKLLVELFGDVVAGKIRILYGGSMKPENASDLLDMEDIDGGLIGGAALTAKSFAALVEIARGK